MLNNFHKKRLNIYIDTIQFHDNLMAEISHGLPHRCNGYRKFLTLSQVHHFRRVERANKEKRGRKRRRVGNKGERGTRNKEEK